MGFEGPTPELMRLSAACGERLNFDFHLQPVVGVAQQLLGKLLCRKIGRQTLRLRITETEAYRGEDDTAFAYTVSPRIGIDYAAPRDRERLWRFTLKPL